MGSRGTRATNEALTNAIASFTALADAYSKSEDSELASDREATELVEGIVASIEAFTAKRRADDLQRAKTALSNALAAVYVRVKAGGGADVEETEAPPSRRTWHEGAWQTPTERRAVLVRMIGRWVPSLGPGVDAAASAADLTAAAIDGYGGPRQAADAVVAGLLERTGIEPGLRGAVVFGLPLV